MKGERESGKPRGQRRGRQRRGKEKRGEWELGGEKEGGIKRGLGGGQVRKKQWDGRNHRKEQEDEWAKESEKRKEGTNEE